MSSCSRHVEGGSLLLFTGEVVPVVVVVAFLTFVVARASLCGSFGNLGAVNVSGDIIGMFIACL